MIWFFRQIDTELHIPRHRSDMEPVSHTRCDVRDHLTSSLQVKMMLCVWMEKTENTSILDY